MKIDEKNKIIHIKVMYYGPASSGKKTSIRMLHVEFGKMGKLEALSESNQLGLSFNYDTIMHQKRRWGVKISAFSSIRPPSHLNEIDGMLFIADCRSSSYQRNLKSWNEFISRFKDSLEDFPIMICFNKQDLKDKFEYIRFLDDIEYTKYKKLDIALIVSKEGEGIRNSFEAIIHLIYLFIS